MHPCYHPAFGMNERGSWRGWFGLGAAVMTAALLGAYRVPAVHQRLAWRLDAAAGIVAGWLYPGELLPTPARAAALLTLPALAPAATPTSGPTPLPTAAPPALPPAAGLPAPAWEKQSWNNCGPATLALAMRYYGWEGDQHDISDLLKPDPGDKNVNVEELVYYVRTRAGWLNAEYRVGGDVETLKRFLAAGFPVVIEKSLVLPPNEGGGWAAHYVLLTGYDDARQEFVTQDTYDGADLPVSYADLDERWHAFNHVYIVVFPAGEAEAVAALMGDEADAEVNRQRALERSQAEVEADPEDAFAWFNLGTNLSHFERYGEAAQAYDRALGLGLPWRFTRYQFGPYIAYFNQGRFEDVIDLATSTLYRTSKSEEARLWRGWARFRLGDLGGALDDFQAALEVNPNYLDARYALDYVRGG
jgi:tetratricopeptide (TPR) repeat protein